MVANTTAMLRTALDRVLGDLKRHYAAYLNAVGPEALDPEGNPIRAPGAYSSAEATAKEALGNKVVKRSLRSDLFLMNVLGAD